MPAIRTLRVPDPVGPAPRPPLMLPVRLDDAGDLAAIVARMGLVQRIAPGRGPCARTTARCSPARRARRGDYARRTYDSYHHGAGTCKMGRATDAMAVVDERLRVRGVSRLQVADASIMPTVVHGNTNLTTLVIGERCADFLREGQ